MVDSVLLERVSRLNDSERLELIGALWDRLEHNHLPVTKDEAAMLDERLARYQADPNAVRPLHDLASDLRANRA